MPVTAEEIKRGFDSAKSARVVVENRWQDVLYYVNNRKKDIQYEAVKGDKLSDDVYDDTAKQSNLILAAGLSGYMTNASQRWFELKTRDDRLMENVGVRQFLGDCTDVIFSALGNSNFYQQVHEMYLDLGAIGTGALCLLTDDQDDIRFYARSPKEIFLVEDDREQVNMVYRSFKMTAYKAYKMFGKDKCGKAILDAIDRNDWEKEFEFIQYIAPRYERDVSKMDSVNKPFGSYWYSCSDRKIVKESGYEEFPYFTPRFYKNSDQTYGYGAGDNAYSDIRMLNRMMEFYIKGAETSVWPPMLAENDSLIGTLDLRAGKINYQQGALSQGQQIVPFETGMKYQIAIDFLQRTEAKIKSAFFSDLFLSLTERPNMTATEVIERTQEKMLILGPVIGRLSSELLSPVITRTFNILSRRGKLPQVPEALVDSEYDIVYVSPLAKAQRSAQARDIQTFLGVVGQMAQMAPEALDNVDPDDVVKKLSRLYGVDPSIIRNGEDVEEIRAMRAQQQQQMAQAEMLQQGANIGKTISEARATGARANATG